MDRYDPKGLAGFLVDWSRSDLDSLNIPPSEPFSICRFFTDLVKDVRCWAQKQKNGNHSYYANCYGGSINAGAGGGGSISLGVAYDGSGNVGVVFSYSAGASFVSASLNAFKTKTNASSIYALGGNYGDTLIIGGSAGDGVGVGADYLIIKDTVKPSGFSGGITLQGGPTLKIPVPLEAHSYLSGGKVIGINIYDVIIGICDYVTG